MLWLEWAAGAVGLFALWFWLATWPAANDIPNPAFFARSLRLLISRGVHKGPVRASLLLCPRGEKGRRLVFVKYIDPTRGTGIKAELARDGWASTHYASLRAELDRRGVAYVESASRDGPALRFDFGRDAGGAYLVARLLFEEMLGLRLHQDCVVYFRDVVLVNAPELTGVDDPNENWL